MRFNPFRTQKRTVFVEQLLVAGDYAFVNSSFTFWFHQCVSFIKCFSTFRTISIEVLQSVYEKKMEFFLNRCVTESVSFPQCGESIGWIYKKQTRVLIIFFYNYKTISLYATTISHAFNNY